MQNYLFQCVDPVDGTPAGFPVAKTITVAVNFSDHVTWPNVLEEFIKFLSNVYGYDISDKVDITYPSFPIQNNEYEEGL